MNDIKQLITYISRYKREFIVSFIFLTLGTFIVSIFPLWLGNVIDNVLIIQKNNEYINKYLIGSSIIIIIVLIFAHIFLYLGNILISKTLPKVISDIRQDIFNKIFYLEISYLEENKQGDITSKITNDLENLNNSLQQIFVSFFNSIFNLFIIVLIILFCNYKIGILTIFVLLLDYLFLKKIIQKSYKEFKILQFSLANLNSICMEIYPNLDILKIENMNNGFLSKADDVIKEIEKSSFYSNLYSYITNPICSILTYTIYTLILFYGSYSLIYNEPFFGSIITLGTLQAYLQYIWRLNSPIAQIVELFPSFQYMGVTSKRIFDFLNISNKKQLLCNNKINNINKTNESNIKKSIEFKNVTFNYELNRKKIFDNVSFYIEKGKNYGIVGSTGIGKSSIINLLLKFYKIDQGNIFIDNKNIDLYKAEDLYNKIGVVFQNPWIFKGTIIENISYGIKENINLEKIIDLSKRVGLHEKVLNLPKKYNTVIIENNNKISQGYLQLINIIRIILRKPEILLMDESTCSLDIELENTLTKVIEKEFFKKDTTTIIIAHKLNIIRNVDIILELNNGTVKPRVNKLVYK